MIKKIAEMLRHCHEVLSIFYDREVDRELSDLLELLRIMRRDNQFILPDIFDDTYSKYHDYMVGKIRHSEFFEQLDMFIIKLHEVAE